MWDHILGVQSAVAVRWVPMGRLMRRLVTGLVSVFVGFCQLGTNLNLSGKRDP